jgi:hypothetical protein
MLCRSVRGSGRFETLCLFIFQALDTVPFEMKALHSSKGLERLTADTLTSQDTQGLLNSNVRNKSDQQS